MGASLEVVCTGDLDKIALITLGVLIRTQSILSESGILSHKKSYKALTHFSFHILRLYVYYHFYR